MFENTNKGVVKKLAARSIKSSRLRNFFILITIALSVALLTGISLYVVGIQEKVKSQLEQMQHVIYQQVTPEMISKLEGDKGIDCALETKSGKNSEISDYTVSPVYVEQKKTVMAVQKAAEGKYPEKANEIMVDKSYMKKLGKNPALGEKISITFYDGTMEEFIITGYTDTKNSGNKYSLFLSKEYAEQGTQLKDEKYDLLVRIKGAEELSEEAFIDLATEIGAKHGVENQNVNENNMFALSLSMTSQELMLIVFVGAVILLVSVLVIYNIFYISVVTRVQQFGELRTVGTTKRQMKALITREGIILCLAGAPIGILIGSIFGYFLQPEGFRWKNLLIIGLIVLGADLITVLASIKKPAAIAANISPVEAVRAIGQVEGKTKKTGKLHRRLSIAGLARISAGSNRKKTLLTMISLGIGGVVFMMAATYMSAVNKEEFSRQTTFKNGEYELYLSQNAVQNEEVGYQQLQKDNPLNEELFESISKLDNFKRMDVYKGLDIRYVYNNLERKDQVTTFSKKQASQLRKGLEEGSLDYDEIMEKDEILIAGNKVAEELYGWKFKMGDKVTLIWNDGNKQREKEFTIAASVESSEETIDILMNTGWFLLPEEALEGMVADNLNLNRSVNIAVKDYKKNGERFEKELNEIIQADSLIKLDTLKEMMKEDTQTLKSLQTMVFGFSFFIIGFSLINLVNTLITNIVAGKHQFAVLQSLGMSKKQVAGMIQGEGFLLAIGNISITLTIGTLFGYLLVELFRSNGISYMHYQFPIYYLAAYALLLLVIPAVVSAISIRIFQKQSLVDRLRVGE